MYTTKLNGYETFNVSVYVYTDTLEVSFFGSVKEEKNMQKWYQQKEADVLKAFNVTKDGHSAEQAEHILRTKGENVLEAGKRKSTFEVFLAQFADLLVIILIAAAVISMMTGNSESTIVILAVIVLNAILGTVQHKNAEKSLDSLKSASVDELSQIVPQEVALRIIEKLNKKN